MTTVRKATHEDIFDLLVLCRGFSQEAPEMHKWDKGKTEELLNSILETPTAVILLSEKDGVVVGFLAGLIQPVLISHTKMASELAWYVDKQHRGAAGAIRLVKAFEEWAEDNGAEWITMADISDVADLSPLYSKLGYKLTEKAYSKRITKCQ